MKPSTYLKQKVKTQKQQLELALKVIDEYLGVEEVEKVLNPTISHKTKKD